MTTLADIQRHVGVPADGKLGPVTLGALAKVLGITEPTRRTINAAGLDIIKESEGLRLKAYPDPGTGGAPWTIGYGHTGADVSPGLVITEAKADELLRSDIARFEDAVAKLVGANATDNQFSALVSFAFNVGAEALRTSTLLRKHNEGDYVGAANEFPKWVKAAGKTLPGLVKRRQREQALYRTSS